MTPELKTPEPLKLQTHTPPISHGRVPTGDVSAVPQPDVARTRILAFVPGLQACRCEKKRISTRRRGSHPRENCTGGLPLLTSCPLTTIKLSTTACRVPHSCTAHSGATCVGKSSTSISCGREDADPTPPTHHKARQLTLEGHRTPVRTYVFCSVSILRKREEGGRRGMLNVAFRRRTRRTRVEISYHPGCSVDRKGTSTGIPMNDTQCVHIILRGSGSVS